MDGHLEASWAGIWLMVSAKVALIYAIVALASAVFWRHRPEWRSWAWVMVIVSFAVLTVLEWPGRRDAGPLAGLDRRFLPDLTVAVWGGGLLAVVLLGVVLNALVRLSLLKYHSPVLKLNLGPAAPETRTLGPATRLLKQTQFRSNDAVSVPISFGVLRPTVVLPTAVEGVVFQAMLPSAVLHEFFAVVRFDALWTLLARLVQCVYFLNPLVWLAFWHYRRAGEQIRDDWSAYAIGDTREYASHLARVAGAAPAVGAMALEVPMARRGRPREVSARLARLDRRSEVRPGIITRTQLTMAVLAWLGILAILGAVRCSAGHADGLRFAFVPPALGVGLAVAGLAGALLLAGTLGARRGPWRQALTDPAAPGVYRQTVAWCVQRVEHEWQAIRPIVSLAGRAADPVLLMLLIVLVVTIGFLVAVEPTEEGLNYARRWGQAPLGTNR